MAPWKRPENSIYWKIIKQTRCIGEIKLGHLRDNKYLDTFAYYCLSTPALK